jgi:hypothetical protein
MTSQWGTRVLQRLKRDSAGPCRAAHILRNEALSFGDPLLTTVDLHTNIGVEYDEYEKVCNSVQVQKVGFMSNY